MFLATQLTLSFPTNPQGFLTDEKLETDRIC